LPPPAICTARPIRSVSGPSLKNRRKQKNSGQGPTSGPSPTTRLRLHWQDSKVSNRLVLCPRKKWSHHHNARLCLQSTVDNRCLIRCRGLPTACSAERDAGRESSLGECRFSKWHVGRLPGPAREQDPNGSGQTRPNNPKRVFLQRPSLSAKGNYFGRGDWGPAIDLWCG
jgi:hypothetical protein